MKKLFSTLILLFTSFMFPFMAVQASNYGIENYQIYVTVEENGDLYVKEAFTMNGSFNGGTRAILYRNAFASSISTGLDYFKGNTIYNGSGIDLIQMKTFSDSTLTLEQMSTNGTKFDKVYSAQSGDYGVYTSTTSSDGVEYRIYSPSKKGNVFYLEYKIQNMAVVHDDVAEVWWNIFDNSTSESIHHLTIDFELPNNQEIIRSWGHGPLVGTTENIDKNHVRMTIDDIPAYTDIEARLVFDKVVVPNSLKFSNKTALESIVAVETEIAEEANLEREQYRKQLEQEKQKKQLMMSISIVLGSFWIIGLILLISHIYKKHDKEYETTFKTKYFRDFPAEYNPSTVGYLFHQTVGNNDLSACLLNLIYKKVVTFETLDKKDYKLTYHETDIILTASDKQLIKLIFKNPEITLKELKKKAKSGYKTFINDFAEWKNMAISEAKNENFYENKIGIKVKSILYSILGMIISMVAFNYIFIFGLILFLLSLVSLIYFLSFTKKTPKGNEHYVKWKALKKFMEDFGTMDKKDLPEIVLWEKYLVYAVSLGCADKLSKTMQLRMNEFSDTDLIDIHYSMRTMRDMMVFNRIMSSTMTTAVNNAYSAQSIANSSNSSGGGFGGGFSGGFGSGGGGGGGSVGRF